MNINENPAVSVVIPTFDRIVFLRRAVESVLRQSWTDFELIVVDDGSTDGTEEAVKTLSDPRIRYFKQSHTGVSCARNTGIGLARGEYIAFLDSDDRWRKKKLEKQVGFMKNHPDCVLCHTDEIWYMNGKHLNPMEKHRKKGGDVFADSLRICVIGMSTIMIRKNLFGEIGLFDPDFPVCEDYDLFLRLSNRYPVCFMPLKLTLKEGGHTDQLSRTSGLDKWRIKALVKLLDTVSLSSEYQVLLFKELERKCMIYGKGCMKRGKVEEGEKYLSLPEKMRYRVRT